MAAQGRDAPRRACSASQVGTDAGCNAVPGYVCFVVVPMLRLHNRAAMFPWTIVGLVANGFVVAACLWLHEPPPQAGIEWVPPGLLFAAVMLVDGLRRVLSRPLLTVTVLDGPVLEVTERWPLRRRVHRLVAARVRAVALHETTDGDGDPYWHARITLDDERHFDAIQGHGRYELEHAVRKLRRVLGLDAARLRGG